MKEQEESITGQLEEMYFEGYYFAPSSPVIQIPNLDAFDFDFSYSYDLPNEALPWFLQRIPPDKITFDIDALDWTLPGAPELSDVDDLLEQLQDVGNPSGIDTTLDERMNYLEENIDELESQDSETRSEISQLLSDAISASEGVVDATLGLLESIGSLAEGLSKAAAIGIVMCVIGAAISSVTGIGSVAFLGIAGTLATVAAYLGIMTVAINGIQVLTGSAYLATTEYVHHLGTYPLVETDLSGMQL